MLAISTYLINPTSLSGFLTILIYLIFPSVLQKGTICFSHFFSTQCYMFIYDLLCLNHQTSPKSNIRLATVPPGSGLRTSQSHSDCPCKLLLPLTTDLNFLKAHGNVQSSSKMHTSRPTTCFSLKLQKCTKNGKEQQKQTSIGYGCIRDITIHYHSSNSFLMILMLLICHIFCGLWTNDPCGNGAPSLRNKSLERLKIVDILRMYQDVQ